MTPDNPPVTKKYKRVDDRWDSLSAEIEANAALLRGQGDLVLKRIGANRFWYLRFVLPPDIAGHRRHRCLYVGRETDEDLVARVRSLLEQIRAPRRLKEEMAAYVRLAGLLNRIVRESAECFNQIAGGED